MHWTRERDLLIAQTMRFVQSITGKKPEAKKLEAEARTEAGIEFAPVDQIENATRPIEIVHEILREVEPAPRPSPTPRSGLREEIQGRVAAFRAHQQLFNRERDAYCDKVLTRVRASIESRPKAPGT
jgi:hypothetical protein